MSYIWLVPLAAGIFIELFFRLIRYRDQSNETGPVPKHTPYNNYISVTEYVSGGKRRWWRYLLFRALPPLLVFILSAAIYQKYSPWLSPLLPIILSATISLLPRDIYQLVKRGIPTSEKIVHLTNIGVVVLIALIAVVFSRAVNLEVLAPSVSGVVDNLWSALFAAVLIVFYLDATNQTSYSNNTEKQNQYNNYVVGAYGKIKQKYDEIISTACTKNDCSTALMYAVLIYENMNRPSLIRKIENKLVVLPKIELTVGIAQIKSSRPLTDKESIETASKRLHGTAELVQKSFERFTDDYGELEARLEDYNGSKTYAHAITEMLSALKQYAPQEF